MNMITLRKQLLHNMYDLNNIGFYSTTEPSDCSAIETQLKAQGAIPSDFPVTEVCSFPKDETEKTWTTYVTAVNRTNVFKGVFYDCVWLEVLPLQEVK